MNNPTLSYRQEKLTPQQIEKASLVRKDMYPQRMPCVRCKREWMAHKGLLCPLQDGYVSTLRGPNGQHVIVPPQFSTNLFVPDENYYKPPDYEVM